MDEGRERWKIGSVGTIGYSKRERKRDVFLPKGTFCAGFARSSLLGEAARTRRATPRRRRNRPRVPAGKFSGGKRVVGIPRARVGTGRRWWDTIGVEKSGDPSLGHEEGWWSVMVGQFPLAGEGKGVSCVVPAGRRVGGDGLGRGRRVAGRGQGESGWNEES